MTRLAGAARLLAVTAVGAGLVAGAATVPGGADLSGAAAAPPTSSTTALRTRQLACPGPETIGVRGSTARQVLPAAATLTVAAAPTSVVGAGGAGRITVGSLPEAGAPTAVPSTGGGARRSATLRAPAGATVTGTGASAVALTGEQTTLVRRGDLRGLVSVTCSAPTADAWLVGGGGEPGRRGRLVLTNPGGGAVQVQVDVLGARGTLARSAGSSLAVAGRSRAVLLLDALAPEITAPVVHVTTTGGAVAAVLHDSRLDGLTPAGADDVSAAAPPATRVVVPGVTVNGRALLRIGVPGPDEAVAQLRLIGPRGAVDPPRGAAVRVRGGGTRDVDLTGVPAGAYAVQVTADVPVVAGAMVERAGPGGRGADLAWLAGAQPLAGTTGLAVVRSTPPWSTTVELTAPGGAARVSLVTVAADGRTRTRVVRVPAGRTSLVAVPTSASAWLRPAAGSGPVVAARTTTVVDAGRLVTGSSLAALPTTEVVPAVRPAS